MRITAITVMNEESGGKYDITVSSVGEVHCSCPAHRYNSGDCKHIKYVRERLLALQQ